MLRRLNNLIEEVMGNKINYNDVIKFHNLLKIMSPEEFYKTIQKNIDKSDFVDLLGELDLLNLKKITYSFHSTFDFDSPFRKNYVDRIDKLINVTKGTIESFGFKNNKFKFSNLSLKDVGTNVIMTGRYTFLLSPEDEIKLRKLTNYDLGMKIIDSLKISGRPFIDPNSIGVNIIGEFGA